MISKLLPDLMREKIELRPCPVADLDGDCWFWTRAVTSKGYGSFSHDGRIWSTHKLAYELLVGTVPEGLQLDHLCRVKRCCNPQHLEAVTGKVNCERTEAATKSRCKRGHALAGPNVRLKSKSRGGKQRECVLCASEIARRQCDRLRTGQRKPSPAWEQRRAAKRAWLIEASEAALADAPIPSEFSGVAS